MTTKPKLKKIPLLKGLPKLPEGVMFLGNGVSVNPGKSFVGWCYNSRTHEWDYGNWVGGFASSYYAAPADSAIAREILGEPAKPVTKRKAAKKTITKPAKTVTKSAKAQETITLRKLPKNVKPGTKVVCVTGGTGVLGHTDEHVRDEMTYTITDNDLTGMVRVGGKWWWDAKRFRLAPAKPAAKKSSKRGGLRSAARSLSLEPSPPETPKERATREWIERLKKTNTSQSAIVTAQKLAGSPVEIIHSDETGEWLWAVTDEYEFWFDAFQTEQGAKDFVAAMGWPMIGGGKPAAQKAAKREGVKTKTGIKLIGGLYTNANLDKFGVTFVESAHLQGINLPDWLPALPPVPSGYDRWEPRGFGWLTFNRPAYAYSPTSTTNWVVREAGRQSPEGKIESFYIEAVRDEKPEAATDNASDHIELHQKEISRIGSPTPYAADYWPQKAEEIRRNSAVGLLTEAAETIGARASERDVESERSMAKCVAAFNVFFADAVAKNGGKLTEEQGWRFMELLKLSRSTVGQKRDDYLDGAAYACLAGECALNQTK